MKDVQFEQTPTVLRLERGDLKRNRKFKKPNASAALFEEEIQVLFEKKDLLGKYNGRSVFKHTVVSHHNQFWVTIEAAGRNMLGRRNTLLYFHSSGVFPNSIKEKPKVVQETIPGI